MNCSPASRSSTVLQKIFPDKTKKKEKKDKNPIRSSERKKDSRSESDVRRFEQISVSKGKHATEEATQNPLHHARTQTSAKEKEKKKKKNGRFGISARRRLPK